MTDNIWNEQMTIEEALTFTDSELAARLMKLEHTGQRQAADQWLLYLNEASPFLLVAHIDTVRTAACEPVKLQTKRTVMTNASGILGADDRAGVYAIIAIATEAKARGLEMPSLLFTDGEESGGIGAGAFCHAFDADAFPHVRLMLEFDRKGCNEYVDYSHSLPAKVSRYMESFGFMKAHGTYSDVADLARKFRIPALNLSIGYYEQHTKGERLHLDEMDLTIARALDMLADPISKQHRLPVYQQPTYYNNLDYYSDLEYYPSQKPYQLTPYENRSALLRKAKLQESQYTFSCKECGAAWMVCKCGDVTSKILFNLEWNEIEIIFDYLLDTDSIYQDLQMALINHINLERTG